MKKLMCLALGVVAACSVAFSQVAVSEVINGNTVVGTVTNVNAGQTLTMGTLITFVSGGQTFTYKVVQTPAGNNNTQQLRDIANAIGNAFNTNNVAGTGGVQDINGRNRFGSNFGEYALDFQSPVPFDLGLSAVLGVGAVAAVKRARNRKKEQELAV